MRNFASILARGGLRRAVFHSKRTRSKKRKRHCEKNKRKNTSTSCARLVIARSLKSALTIISQAKHWREKSPARSAASGKRLRDGKNISEEFASIKLTRQ
jgi:hypothetical protein